MPFGGRAKMPNPLPPPPILQPSIAGEQQEKMRRKLALGRSNSLLTRGLLFQSPAILHPQLFGGTKSRLGE